MAVAEGASSPLEVGRLLPQHSFWRQRPHQGLHFVVFPLVYLESHDLSPGQDGRTLFLELHHEILPYTMCFFSFFLLALGQPWKLHVKNQVSLISLSPSMSTWNRVLPHNYFTSGGLHCVIPQLFDKYICYTSQHGLNKGTTIGVSKLNVKFIQHSLFKAKGFLILF